MEDFRKRVIISADIADIDIGDSERSPRVTQKAISFARPSTRSFRIN